MSRKKIGMKRFLLLNLCLASVFMFSLSAYGQESVPGDVCTINNAIRFAGGVEASGRGYYMVCQNSVWVRILETNATGYLGIGQASPKAPLHVGGEVIIGLTTGMECSPDLAGAVRFDDAEGKMELCDGSAWEAIGGGNLELEQTTGSSPIFNNDLDDLEDVSASSPIDGQCLMWDTDTGQWLAQDCASEGVAVVEQLTGSDPVFNNDLDDLGDVSASAPIDGQCLGWDNTAGKWKPQDCAEETNPLVVGQFAGLEPVFNNDLDDLGDIDASSPTDGQCLVWDTGTGQWMAQDCAATPAGSTGEIQFNDSASFASSTSLFWDNTNSFLGINTAIPEAALDVVGDIHYTGLIVDVSDIRLKTNIKPITGVLPDILKLKAISFTMKDDPKERREYGFSAQEVREVFPDLVVENDDEMKTLSINYVGMVAPMIEAMKELKAENDGLRTRVEKLESAQNKDI